LDNAKKTSAPFPLIMKTNLLAVKNYFTRIYSKPIVIDAISTTIFSIVGKAVGFLIPFFIAIWFGANYETDAFFLGFGIVLFLITIFSPVLESIVVPYIAEAQENSEDVGLIIGSVFIFTLFIFLSLSGLIYLGRWPLFFY